MSVAAPRTARADAVGLWWSAFAIAAFVLSWPLIGGECAANDDLKYVRTIEFVGDPWAAIVDAWRHGALFRPLEILVGSTCDPEALRPGWAVAVQWAGLLVLLGATTSLARLVAPGRAALSPLALLLVLLSPGTTNAFWQFDAASQTWSAALGALALVLAWRGFEAATVRRPSLAIALLLGLVFVVGCSLKETFYGWSAAIGGSLVIAWLVLMRRKSPGAAGVALLLVPTVVIPLAHLVLRAATGAIGTGAGAAEGGRYQAEFGLNLVINAAFVVAGSFANGPFHAVMDPAAPAPVRLLPLVSCLFILGALIVAVALWWSHRRDGNREPLRAAFVAAVCLASTSATLPGGAVSELHCLGANIGTSILVALVIVSLCNPASGDERAVGRAVGFGAFAMVASIGMFGLAGRAYHHWITWQYARLTNDAVLAHAAAVDPVDPASGKAAGVIYLSAPCILGRTYGQYVIPPAQAIGIDSTQPWLMKRDPTRPIVFSVNPPPGVLRPGDMVLDCSAMPRRASW